MKTCPNCQEKHSRKTKFCKASCYYAFRIGENHPNWKGGSRPTNGGYRYVVVQPSHPFFESMGRVHQKNMVSRTILEHRLVLAESLGRPLRSDETVHHKNGVKDDNRLENLELRTGNHGRGTTLCCKDCGSTNLIPA